MASNVELFGGFPVMKEKCNECLFTGNRIVPGEAAAAILQKCAKNDSHFVCHKATIVDQGLEVCCRGFYDRDPSATNLMRAMGRLRMVVEVTEDDIKAAGRRLGKK